VSDLTANFQNLLRERVLLRNSVEDLHQTYRDGKPFPHVVVDNLFPEAMLDSLLVEMAEMGRERWSSIEQDTRERTLRMRSAAEMGAAGNQLLSVVHSAAFLYLLSEITGIAQLLPDPYLQGSGYALMRRSDYFSVHSDRNVAYETGLVRRLAMIVFLNKSWKPEYHGDLELWSHDAKRCDVSIAPLYNKTVIFEVANPNFHGVPTPLACPADRMRQSFILYYHTTVSKSGLELKPHTSIFAPRLYGTNRATIKSLIRDMVPPLVVRAIRRLRKFES
jgi:Rps23 Pro-64 3,4-dihydroxylase Tpa1-like proline 4-hydroxylase